MTEEDMIVAARLAAYYEIDPSMTLAEIHQAMKGTAIWETCALEVKIEKLQKQLLDALCPLVHRFECAASIGCSTGSHLRRLLSTVRRAYWRAVKRELKRENGE